MIPKLVVICILISLIHKSYSACLCGFGEGKDTCAESFPSGGGPSCTPMVVRPAPNPQIPFITGVTGPFRKPRIVCKEVIDGHPSNLRPLRPIGDLCSCRQTIVMPANVPRPACRKCGGNPTIYEPVPVVEYSEPPIYPSQTGTGSGIPADAVSLGIVSAQSRRDCGWFADDRLSYGPGKLPLDKPILKPSKSKLPERNLYQIKGVPIELIPFPCQRSQSKSLDDEAIEDLLLEEEFREEQEQDMRTIPQFTYDDLGFSIVTPNQPKYIAVQGTAPEEETSEEHIIDDIEDFHGRRICKDGYKPGNVIIKSIPHREVYVPAPTIPINCPGEEYDDTILYPVIPHSYPVYPGTASDSEYEPYPVYPGTESDIEYEPYPCDS